MCKKLIILVAFCAVELFSGAALADVDESGRLIVPETSVAPVIDGELEDVWQDASEESLLITDIINAGGNVPPDDDSDLSGIFKVMYDADNIYFFLAVQDSVLDYEFSDYRGDSVEIYFDGDNSKGSSYDGINDNQIRINTDDTVLDDLGKNLPIDGTTFKVLLTDTGYNIEAAFPLVVLQLVPEQTFGFEVQLNDNDGGGGRETMIRWFSNDNNSWQDASLFGEAILVPEPEPVDPGSDRLVAYYAFENNADDSSGNGLNGTLVGDPVFGEGPADYGMALDLDGIDDVVELGKFDVNGLITLATWIKADDFEINDARIITKANEWGGNDHWWMLSTISETSLRFRLKTDDGQDTATLISDPVLEAGVWANVAATWDGSAMRIYKDGVEVASQDKGGTAVAVDPDVSVAIGSQPSDAFASDPGHVAKFFDGLIDEVQIYERALSEGEVLYLAGFRVPDVLSGLSDVTVVDGAIVSIRNEGTDYVVADEDLMLGTTTRWYIDAGVETLWAEGDPAPAATMSGTSNPKEGDVGSKADNFLFTLDGSTNISSIDGIDFQETLFPALADTFFLFERGGNDVGTWQAILADGSLGAPVEFDKASAGGPYANTGIKVNGQDAYGVVFKTVMLVQGVRITASGHDTLSISAVPAP